MSSSYRSSARLDDSRSDICDLGYDEVIEYLHSFLPTSERNGANDDLSDPPNRVRILCVPNSPLSCQNLILIVATESWVQLAAEKQL